MTYNELINKACTFKGKSLEYTSYNEINNNIIEILKICLKNKLKLNFKERDYVKIIKIYYEINKTYYDEFIKGIIGLSINKIDYSKILKQLEE